ncbi:MULTISPECIES: hypothetical protein [Tatumella]|uniref:Uncharacterized protein n=1 Tax=Tatumella punctata TaxID=399969 RepID=A0ABW1VPQ5_9GAMM|nr:MULTISPECIES: hypothetical protein [unclassified Tatumella]MBS0855879.1 hypothetical protein [Tatumella sp. JGM16]MBS0876997.1 hypothetical protein [Tatumella sp. JGM82]MBS0890866.1 hypothetical protein [Tatumella sp. JGM94]MBS0893585.1 hypothetical protein [Tatumella sp. JGM130]MBS0901889.1 hypothetical protein [Tatumella sp. JGM100]
MRQWILLLIGLWSGFGLAAQGYQFSLKGRSDIDQEILVAEVISFHQYLGGGLTVQWYLSDADQLAKRIKQRLISAGISPEYVQLQKQPTQNSAETAALVSIMLNTEKNGSLCQSQQSTYRFDTYPDIGCAVDNNLKASQRRETTIN